ncbi:hypothetical protein JCGZ_19714 [Jatropha curcas]|uniref:Aminotransferase-like plant mobile domain-containing protein n=1 Tax=Jatropha curcas TaxID=180498 RepID=A0A067JVW7_JATCU|nr:hypothetical protein JCGZ_19714 [Jatropha curcas]
MRARVVAVGFGDYAAGLRRTQPCFLPAMRYALMERWNDCTHTFIFGFGEMTLALADYAAITGLRFTGPVPPVDAWYDHTSTVSIRVVRAVTLLPRIPRYLAHCHHTYASGKDPEYWRSFLNDRELSDEMCAVMDHHPDQDRYDLVEIMALCPVYLPDGINADQGLPLEPFLNGVLSIDLDPSWI